MDGKIGSQKSGINLGGKIWRDSLGVFASFFSTCSLVWKDKRKLSWGLLKAIIRASTYPQKGGLRPIDQKYEDTQSQLEEDGHFTMRLNSLFSSNCFSIKKEDDTGPSYRRTARFEGTCRKILELFSDKILEISGLSTILIWAWT